MRVEILGPLRVLDEAGRPVRLGGPKPRAALGRLALGAATVVSTDRLIEDLWEGDPPATARQSLHVHLSQLRRVLGAERILTEPPGYMLSLDRAELDSTRFEALLDQAAAARAAGDPAVVEGLLREAVGLWRGPLLADLGDYTFVASAAARLEEARMAALESLVEARLDCGQHADLAAELEALTREHPLRERLWRARMTALYRAGRQADSLRVYQELRRTLAEELGIDPAAETRALEKDILEHAASLEWASPRLSGRVPPDGPAMHPVEPGEASAALALPAGDVTFMFTDIEGSTRLHQRLGKAFTPLIAEHDRLLSDIVERVGGRVIKHLGDGMLAAFTDAEAATKSAAQIQLAVTSHPWPDQEQVRVRIGLNRGEAEPQGHDYVSIALHQASRVCTAAYGGQVLATEAVAEAPKRGAEPFVSDASQSGVELDNAAPVSWKHLGAYRLKDFDDPVPLYQLVGPGLPEAPSSTRATPAAAHNVPDIRTSFVGREEELKELCRILGDGTRLVTIVGPGGVGKTRLAFEVAKALASQRSDGVWVALLANAKSHELDDRLLRALQVPQRSGMSPRETLLQVLSQRETMIVFDNCEHIVDEVADLAQNILDVAPDVAILATSREPLRLPDEAEWRLAPLSADADAVELFMQRAATRNPRLRVTDSDRRLVESICRAVDGLPLAVELAAGRLRHMPLASLASRIEDRFRVLSLGDRTLDSRQRTLYDLVDWSYGLLTPSARRLLDRLSVFRAPMRLDAIEAVASDVDDAEESLAELVDKSLIVVEDDQRRPFRMLVTIRDFAARKLGDDHATRLRHAEWHRELAGLIMKGCNGLDAELWLAEGDFAYDDLIAAMSFCAENGLGDLLAELATGMHWYATMRGRLSEGLRWMEQASRLANDPRLKAYALARAGSFAHFLGRPEYGRDLCIEALRRAEATGDRDVILEAEGRLGQLFAVLGQLGDARVHYTLATESDNPTIRAMALIGLGVVAFFDGDLIVAENHYREALDFSMERGLLGSLYISQMNLGEVLLERGQLEEAETALKDAVEGIKRFSRYNLPLGLEMLARLHASRGETDEAERYRLEAINAAREIGDVTTQNRLQETLAS